MSDPAVAAAEAASAAEVAAVAAEHASEAAEDAAAQPAVDPNVLIAADTDLARIEAETEQARIAARTEIKLAELRAEEPEWLNRLWECLGRIEARLTAMAAIPSLTQQPLTETTVVVAEEPEAPTVGEVVAAPESTESVGETPVSPEAQNPPPAPPAPRAKRRWI